MIRWDFAFLLVCCSNFAGASPARGEGYYDKTLMRNPATGRQEIIDLHVPHWRGPGQGGLMFDGPSGCLQMAAVDRNPRTGRLEYFNQYVNPWSGARYATATQFNPFIGRYQTIHRFSPPPDREEPSVAVPAAGAVAKPTPVPQRGIRVINAASAEQMQSPASQLGQPPTKPSAPRGYPRGGVTIKILEPLFPDPPTALSSERGN